MAHINRYTTIQSLILSALLATAVTKGVYAEKINSSIQEQKSDAVLELTEMSDEQLTAMQMELEKTGDAGMERLFFHVKEEVENRKMNSEKAYD